MNHRYARETNIARYRKLLETEADAVKRATIEQLLADEERARDGEGHDQRGAGGREV